MAHPTRSPQSLRSPPSRVTGHCRGPVLSTLGRLAVLLLLVLVSGCTADAPAALDPHAPAIDKTRQDFRDLGRPPDGQAGAGAPDQGPQQLVPEIPELYPVLVAPEPPPLSYNPRVSLAVTDDVPLKDVLFQLARQSGVDIEIDPRISGGVMLSIRNRPLLDVIDRVSRLAGLRYRAEDDIVRVEIDEPYVATYQLSALSLSREARGDISIDTEVATPGTDATGAGSSSSVSAQSSVDFFAELEASLEAIVANTRPRGLPMDDAGAEVVIHRQSGVVSVFGTAGQHAMIADVLSRIERQMANQILIEAKLIEVALSEEHRSGINWRAVFGVGGVSINSAARFGTDVSAGPFDSFNVATPDVFTLAIDSADIGAVVNAVEAFGTTRTLSSPRLTVLNNQTALLKVADNEIYFETDVERETDQETNP